MPLLSCPQCGQSVSSLASACPKCSYPLREQRLQQRQMGPLITCRKCLQKIPSKSRVCPHCGVDHPRKTFAVWTAAVPIAVLLSVIVLAAVLRGGAEPVGQPVEPTAESTEPAVTPDVPADSGPTAGPSDSAAEVLPEVPTGTPSPVMAPRRAVVSSEPTTQFAVRWTSTWANLRSARSPESPVVRILDPGQRVEVGDLRAGWWAVYEAGQLVGYVANSVLQTEAPSL